MMHARLTPPPREEVPKFTPLKPEITPIAVSVEKIGLAVSNSYATYIRNFQSRPKGNVSFEGKLDYAVALIFTGSYLEATAVLHELELERPGVYATAANLGTAYELAGDLDNALQWISEGVKRDPKSHGGSEWLHVAILRAKIQLRQNPRWLEQRSVLDETETRPAAEVVRAIERQLNERLAFVQPLDAVVCDLFYQAALRLDPATAAEKRAHFIKQSLEFGDWRKAQIENLAKS